MKNSKLFSSTESRLLRFIILAIIFNLNMNIVFGQWMYRNPPIEKGYMISSDFRNYNTGFVGGWWFLNISGNITATGFNTNNAGNSWTNSNIPDSVRAMVDVLFISDDTGYCVGAYNPRLTGNSKKENFNDKIQTNNLVLDQFYRSNGMTPVPDYDAILLKTTDGGKSWFPFGEIPEYYNYLYDLDLIDNQKGIVIGTRQGNADFHPGISKTEDGCRNWTNLQVPVLEGDLVKVQCFVSDIHTAGYETTDSIKTGVILKSSDEGNIWSKKTFDDISNFTDIKFADKNTGYVSGIEKELDPLFNSRIYKTTDAGNTWIDLNLYLDSISISRIQVLKNSGNIIIYGHTHMKNEYIMYKELFIGISSDYGATWNFQKLLNPNYEYPDEIVGCSFLNSENIYLTGGNTLFINLTLYIDPIVLVTTDGGLTFNNTTHTLAGSYSLSQNYPNPFNPSTIIRYNIPSETHNNSSVLLKVFDISGKEVATLVNQKQSPGSYEVTFNAYNLSSGIYFYRLEADGFVETKKMTVLK